MVGYPRITYVIGVKVANVEKLQGLAPETLFDEIYSRVDANPERAGCPPYRILMELATRARPFEDPAWEHVMRCPPCGTRGYGR